MRSSIWWGRGRAWGLPLSGCGSPGCCRSATDLTRSRPTCGASRSRPAHSAPANCARRPSSPMPGSSPSTGITCSGWKAGVSSASEVNPVARSNVCPEIDPPATPSLYAFCCTRRPSGRATPTLSPPAAARPTAPRVPTPSGSSATATPRPTGCAEKARFVLGAMELRMAALGRSWADATAT